LWLLLLTRPSLPGSSDKNQQLQRQLAGLHSQGFFHKKLCRYFPELSSRKLQMQTPSNAADDRAAQAEALIR
jgi:hypothetical protein